MRAQSQIGQRDERFEDVPRGEFGGRAGRDQVQTRIPLPNVRVIITQSLAGCRREFEFVARSAAVERVEEFLIAVVHAKFESRSRIA